MAEHLEGELAELFARAPELGVSLAAVVAVGGELVAERYGTQPATMFSPESAVRADTPLVSWSSAKSITHAAIGVAAMSGLIEVEGRAPVPGWEGTEKEAITILDLLEMR
ncbi:MAG: beta-lactamase family protein, partial [Actinomycetota bacterium]|nr:beta-lactamase family protein [Actinomycetota bacterium]